MTLRLNISITWFDYDWRLDTEVEDSRNTVAIDVYNILATFGLLIDNGYFLGGVWLRQELLRKWLPSCSSAFSNHGHIKEDKK